MNKLASPALFLLVALLGAASLSAQDVEPVLQKCHAGKVLLKNGEWCDDWWGGAGAGIPTGCTFLYDISIEENGECPDPCKFKMQASQTGTAANPVSILQWDSSSSGNGKDNSGPLYVLDEDLTVECSESSGHYDCIHISASWNPQNSSQANYRLTCSKCKDAE